MKTTILLACALAAAAVACSNEKRPATSPTTTTSSPDYTPATTPAQPMAPPVEPTPAEVPAPASPTLPPITGTSASTGASAGALVTSNPGTADQTKAADNTKTNERDRHGTLTPMDQGNSGDETKITASIRKGMMGDKSLSFTAKNVKVITTGTKVTLRGPVKSDQERATIEDIARKTAGVTDVDNQLEVKK